MDVKVISQKFNALMNREEILFEWEAEKTPSIKEVDEFLAKKFNTSVENIKVNRIKGNFGAQVFNVEADIYKTLEHKQKFGVIKKRVKKKKKGGNKGGKK
jgi:ribosomal protein S24E